VVPLAGLDHRGRRQVLRVAAHLHADTGRPWVEIGRFPVRRASVGHLRVQAVPNLRLIDGRAH
jgi:hypothetical protein